MSSITPQQQKKTRKNGRGRGPRKGRKSVQQQNRPKKVVRVQQTRRPRQRRQGGLAGTMSVRTASGVGATSFKSGRARTITVQNEEFIGAVTVANQPNFNVVSYPVNPGQAGTFPWLSLMAPQWEKYTFNMLEFYFKREVSEFATAGSAGKVIFSADFDASDSPPTTKQQMEDSVPHADSMPCENLVLRLPRNQMHVNSLAKYVRSAGLPGNADIKTYDVANLHVATQGIPSNTEIGELRVRYSCTFSVPVLDSTNAAPANNSVSLFQQGDVAAAATTVQQTIAFATASTNGLLIVNTAGSFVPPAGNYKVEATILSTQSVANTALTGTFQLQKNTVDIVPDVVLDGPVRAAGTTAIHSVFQAFVSCNGTDAITCTATLTYAAGAPVTRGTILFSAV